MGQIMGRMHALTRNYTPSSPAIKRREWYEESSGFAEQCLPPSEQDAIDRFNASGAYLRTLPAPPDAYGLVHTDFHAGNFFLCNGQITLFDFDDCQYSWFVDDIAMAIFYAVLGGHTDEERLARARAFVLPFLQGYYQENWLDPSWFAHIPHFFKVREIGVYAAIHAHCGGDLDKLDEGGRIYLLERRDRIARDVPYLDLDLEAIARQQVS
jgi:Ser/Thr protein kinase RdoA (MazF antagonist)